MMLIAIDNDAKSVMHYLADDKSPEAIAAEVRRAGFAGHTWREITKTEYAQIRASRPKPKPVMPSLPANADAGMMEALGVLVDAVEPSSQPDSASYEDLLRMIQTIAHQVDMHATMIANQAVAIEQQQSIIDAILNAKIPLDVKQERVA